MEITEGPGPYSSHQNITIIGLNIEFDLVSDGPRPLQFLAGLTAKQSNEGGGKKLLQLFWDLLIAKFWGLHPTFTFV